MMLKKRHNQKATVIMIWSVCAVYLLQLLFANSIVWATSQTRVLMISSYSPVFPTFMNQIAGVRSVLTDEKVVLDVEYMDSKRFYTPESVALFYDYLKYKLEHSQPYDAIIVADDNALVFVRQYQQELFDGLPIVFMGINDIESANLSHESFLMTGLVEAVSIDETIDLAKKLNPDAQNVVAIIDNTGVGQVNKVIYENLASQFPELNFKELNVSEYTEAETLKHMHEISDKDIVLLIAEHLDIDGRQISFGEGLSRLLENVNQPIYHLYDFGIGQGLVGGKVVDFYEQGKVAAGIVNRVLNGEDIKTIPVENGSTNYIFDDQVMRKYGLNDSMLPSDTILLNEIKPMFEAYQTELTTLAVVFLMMLIVITFLMLNVRKRKMAEKALIDKHQELGGLYQELTALYEELEASEQELQNQYDEIQESKKKLEESETRYELVFDASNEGLYEWNLKTDLVYFSKTWHEALLDEKIVDETKFLKFWQEHIHPDDLVKRNECVQQLLNGEIKKYRIDYRVRNQMRKSWVWIHEIAAGYFDRQNVLVRIAGSRGDITDKKSYEIQLKNLAYNDLLTGLSNRSDLSDKISISMKQPNGMVSGALYLIGIDNFKYVNDTFGHEVGDALLKEIAVRLKKLHGDEFTVGRLSSDQFVVIQNNVHRVEQIVRLSKSIQNLFNERFEMFMRDIYITCSIGIATYPDQGTNLDELVKNADLAMKKAKAMGKNRYEFFELAMNSEVEEKVFVQSNLREALIRDEFVLYFQPQIDSETGRILGFEALIRWISKERGFISPDQFIKVAEETGMIIPIGNWVMQKACQFIKVINELNVVGAPPIVVTVNVSAIQLAQNNFLEQLKSIIEDAGIESTHFGIEITETALMTSFELNADKLKVLKSLGVHTSLDDFGTGYSSLNYLRHLPISTLKMDRSFIEEIAYNEDDANLAEGIMMIAHKMGLYVIAEGVENQAQLERLREMHCDGIQGFYFSKPLPEKMAIDYWKSNTHLLEKKSEL